MRPVVRLGALVLSPVLTPLPTDAQWDKVPTIILSAPAQDPRILLTLEAIAFWNRQLAEIGTPFRLGAVTQTTETLPADYLTRLSAAVLTREPRPNVPESVRRMPGDLIIALSDGDFISFASWVRSATKVVVGIRSDQRYPLSLPNVGRNVIAHELGHAIGLQHNDDPTTLMCGRPAPCRPAVFQSDVARFFPLTEADKGILLRLYPPTWTPTRCPPRGDRHCRAASGGKNPSDSDRPQCPGGGGPRAGALHSRDTTNSEGPVHRFWAWPSRFRLALL
jgi:hypothetical protein